MILTIPYKRLARCNLEELAAQSSMNERRERLTSGVSFAQKLEHAEKDAAREQILQLAAKMHTPGQRLRTLTMPGMSWMFESRLLKRIEPTWRTQQRVKAIELTCIENDRFIYNSAATKMPGNKGTMLRTLERPPYAELALGNGIIERFIFANVDDAIVHEHGFDLVWLDYTGPLSVDRIRKIRAFWLAESCRVLVVTSLKARWNKETARAIERAGGVIAWQRKHLPGTVLHELEYQDGASPMVQFAVRHTP